MRSIPFAEQETIIRWSADETRATISTSNPVTIRKLDKLVQEAPEAYTKLHDLTDDHDARYTMPVDRIRFAKPASEAYRESRRKSGFKPAYMRNEQTSSIPVDTFPT